MGEENFNESLWNQVYYIDDQTGEFKPISLEPVDFIEDKEKVVITIPKNAEFTISCTQTNKEARKTRKIVRALINSHKRRIRNWYRTKERLRRANLKGKKYIGMSPRIANYLMYKYYNAQN